jgi:hypothetical protein
VFQGFLVFVYGTYHEFIMHTPNAREALGRAVLDIYSAVCNRVLRMAEAALPPTQFRAFRKLVLDEFGEQGAQQQIKRLFRLTAASGEAGSGMAQDMAGAGTHVTSGKGGGADG